MPNVVLVVLQIALLLLALALGALGIFNIVKINQAIESDPGASSYLESARVSWWMVTVFALFTALSLTTYLIWSKWNPKDAVFEERKLEDCRREKEELAASHAKEKAIWLELDRQYRNGMQLQEDADKFSKAEHKKRVWSRIG
jgi:hypothetical protein